MWLVGVVVRRSIDFLILLIPTPLVSVLSAAASLLFVHNGYSVPLAGFTVIINPRRACAARVTVVVLCVCVHSYLPPHTLESQNRDTNGFCAIQGSF